MSELLVAVGAGALWCTPFLLLVVCAARLLRATPGAAILVAYPAFFAGQAFLAKAMGAVDLLTTPAFRIVYLAAGIVGIGTCVRLLGWRADLWIPRRPRQADADTILIRRLALGTAGALLVGVALFSLISPVHVWDVLAYHMPMVASYVQNGSLEAWATQDLRQIYRVNAGELQLLNVALLAGSDTWMALPGVLALAVFLVGAFELGRLALSRPLLPFLGVALVLTAPQVLVAATTAKNDLTFSAVLLASFYWMIRAGGARGGDRADGIGTSMSAVLAGLCGALAAATKVMGLNVLGAVGLLALALAFRSRLRPAHLLAFGGAALAALLLLAGDTYWSNFAGGAVPVGVAPGEIQFTMGVANLVEAARYYFYDLSFRRLVIPQVFEHDFLHYGYFFPFTLALALWAGLRQVHARRYVLSALTLAGAALFASVIAVRLPIQWDQRFMIWMVPVAAILALSLTERLADRTLLALGGFAAGLAFMNLALTVTMESDRLLFRSVEHLLATRSVPHYLDVPNTRYLYQNDGFEVLDLEAHPADSVLYAGTDDSWMYLAWGPQFTRHVEGVRDADHASDAVASRRFRFIVMEYKVRPEIGQVIRRQARGSGYAVRVEADGRVIFVREAEPEDSGSPGGGPTDGDGGHAP